MLLRDIRDSEHLCVESRGCIRGCGTQSAELRSTTIEIAGKRLKQCVVCMQKPTGAKKFTGDHGWTTLVVYGKQFHRAREDLKPE